MIIYCQVYNKRCHRTYCEKNLSCGLGGTKKPLQFETEEDLDLYMERITSTTPTARKLNESLIKKTEEDD